MTAVAVPSMRMSTIRDCPRRAIAEATGQPARELYDREHRIMYSGKVIGQSWLDMWQESHPGETVIREKKVAHEFGVGHEDGFIVSSGTVLEILSSAHASSAMVHSKLLQLTLYIEHDPDATGGVLLIVDPRDYSDERVILVKGTDKYVTLVEEAMTRMAQVREWSTTGELPDRVCSKPSEARSHFCRSAEWCFEGWEPPAHEEITDETVHELVARDYHAREKEREVKATLKVIEEERKQIEAELADHVDAGEWQVSGYVVKRSDRTRRSFKLALAEEDSRIPGDLLDEFTNVSNYTVWTIDQALAATGDVDYGDVPF